MLQDCGAALLLTQSHLLPRLPNVEALSVIAMDGLNLDSWSGYEAPRERILSRFAGLKNCVVLTGDEHQNFCGDLVLKDKVVGAEFVATSISGIV